MPSDALNKGGPGAVPAAAAVRAFRQLWVAFRLFVCVPSSPEGEFDSSNRFDLSKSSCRAECLNSRTTRIKVSLYTTRTN